MIQEIRLGLPKGSLNNPERADTKGVLTDAGYDVRGYVSGKESAGRLLIANDPEIKAFLGRPEASPDQLSRGLIDIAITGADWVAEASISSGKRYGVRKIGGLEYGQVRLVIAVAENSGYESLSDVFRTLNGRGRNRPILCSTEYMNLAARAFMQNEAYLELYGKRTPFIQYRGLTRGSNRGSNRRVQILGSDGATEASEAMGFDIIVDNAQSGQSLKDARLREIGQIMKSSAGLYAGPSCTGWKEEKARKIYKQLYGAVIANRYFFVFMNVPSINRLGATDYLVSEGLCTKEPSVVPGKEYDQVNTLLPRDRYPEALETLTEKFGVCDVVKIDTTQYIK